MDDVLFSMDQLERLPTIQRGSDEAFDMLAKVRESLGRLQLYSKGTPIDKALVSPGEYGIPGDDGNIEVLGNSIDLLPLARRPKAVDLSDVDIIPTSYDIGSSVFQSIVRRISHNQALGMYGVSFLVIERTTGQMLEFFCGTKSTRPEAAKIYQFLPLSAADIARKAEAGADVSKMEPHGPLAMTLKSRLVEAKDFSWHVPVVLPCSTPFNKLPKTEAVIEEIKKFVTAKQDGPEKVEEPVKTSGRRR